MRVADGAVKSKGVAPSIIGATFVAETPSVVVVPSVVSSRLTICKGEFVLGLVTREETDSSVSGERFRLLESLFLPGGVEVLKGFPSNGDSSRGGRLSRHTIDQGVHAVLGLTIRTKSEVPYLIFVLCLISPCL